MISKRQVLITQLVNEAAAGTDLRAIEMLLDFDHRREAQLAGGLDFGQGGLHDGIGAKEVEAELPDLANMSAADLNVLFQATLVMDGKRECPLVAMPMPPANPAETEKWTEPHSRQA
jgi:hypothetical protein